MEILWKHLPKQGTPPNPRSSHTSVFYNNCVYIFGGFDDSQMCHNDLFCFQLNSQKWKKIETKSAPEPRSSHSAVVYKDRMYVFGGYSPTVYFNDVHSFNFLTGEWTCHIPNRINFYPSYPSIRFGHSAVLHHDEMIIFGGKNLFDAFNDVWSLNLETFDEWKLLQCKGEIPEKIRKHSAVIYNNFMFVFGGSIGFQFETNGFYKLDLINKIWYKIISTNPPLPRCGHSMFVYEDSIFVYSGREFDHEDGVHRFDIYSQKWIELKQEGEIPSGRYSHSHCSAVIDKKPIVIIFGGRRHNIERLNDLNMLVIKKLHLNVIHQLEEKKFVDIILQFSNYVQ